jgi:osmotically-inducible protein OsmY
VLKTDPETMRLDLTVVVEGDQVTLKGVVFTGIAKDNAEKIVRSVVGVKSVENQLRVYREW